MPLQLAVKSPEDLAFKAAAERQYLIFNLLAGGKLAWDRGDYDGPRPRGGNRCCARPASRRELDALVRPLARRRAREGRR